MSLKPPSQAPLPSESAVESDTKARSGWRARLLKAPFFAWKYLLGALACQAWPLAVIGAGWTYHAARRSALKAIWKASPQNQAQTSIDGLAEKHTIYQSFCRWPNWILASNWRQRFTEKHPWRKRFAGFFQALASNLWLGFRAWLHTFVFLALPTALMMFSWYSGWDNSFNKGYEQFHVGAVLGWIGIMGFIAVMFHLPLAQARFALTGRARSFYQFRFLRRIVRRQWPYCVLLAAAHALAMLPLMAGDGFLGVATAESNASKPNKLADLTPAQALDFLESYYFYWGFYVFAAFLFLRCWAARIYARGLIHCVQSGRLPEDAPELATREREVLAHCGIAPINEKPRRRLGWLSHQSARVLLGGFLAALFWFAVAAQSYVTQFFAFQHEMRRWINQPLIQLPWFNHIPGHLKEAVKDNADDA